MFHTKSPQYSGFTLIELLVVLGVIGLLAAAILAAINPVEQIKKGQDANLKYLASQYAGASTRYYTTRSALPWFAVANGGINCYSGGANLTNIPVTSLGSCTAALISLGELKQSFTSANSLGSLFVTSPNPATGSISDTVVCFQPTSVSQQLDPNTKYAQNGAAGTSCKSQHGSNTCYWCEP